MTTKLLAAVLTPLSLVVATGGAFAQSPPQPDAGSLRQQIDQQREFRLPEASPPKRVAPPPEIKPQAGLSIKIKSIQFQGNTLLNAEQLSAAVADFVGKEVGFDGLQRATDAVASAYRQAGWIVRVYLPEQDISEGLVKMHVLEARYAGLKFEGDASQRVMRSEITSYFNVRQRKGEPLNADAMDRALLLADDLPGVSVAGTLAPGDADGETALVVQTTDEPFFYGDIGMDNTGARSTGSTRLLVNMSVNSLGQRGELIGLNVLKTEGSDYGRFSMTVPDGHDGLRVGFNMSAMNYHVVGGPADTQALQIKGRSGSVGVDLNYPIVRERIGNLYGSISLENKSFYSEDINKALNDSKSYADYGTFSLRMGMSGNRFDDLGGGGSNSASVQMTFGKMTSMLAHRQLHGLDGSYRKLNYSFSRQQALIGQHSAYISLSGQHATQVLDSSEKFYIGGAQSVRAYPVSELGGERGQSLSAEWRWRLDSAWVLSAFADVARVVSLPPTSSDQRKALKLRGQGLTASWQGPMGRVHGRLTKLTGIHFAQPLITLDGVLHLAALLFCIIENRLHLGVGIGVDDLIRFAARVDNLDSV